MIDNWKTISDRYDRKFRKIVILSEQQNHRCCYCGCVMFIAKSQTQFKRINAATIEHVVPKAQKGVKDYENEIAACRLCNNIRSADDPYEFYEWRQLHLDDDVRTLQKAISKYRRAKLKAAANLEKEALYQTRLSAALQTPYVMRVMHIALKRTFSLIHSVIGEITARKYRRPPSLQDADGKTGRNRSGSKGRHRRPRHGSQNTLGNPNAGQTDSGGEVRV